MTTRDEGQRGPVGHETPREARPAPRRQRLRRTLPGLVVGLALLAAAPLAFWTLWPTRGPELEGAAEGSGVSGANNALPRVVASSSLPVQAPPLPRPPRAEPVPLASPDADSAWGARFASTVGAFAALAFDSAQRTVQRQVRAGIRAAEAAERKAAQAARDELPPEASDLSRPRTGWQSDREPPPLRVFGFDVPQETNPEPPDTDG